MKPSLASTVMTNNMMFVMTLWETLLGYEPASKMKAIETNLTGAGQHVKNVRPSNSRKSS
jgi:hypothetical protein